MLLLLLLLAQCTEAKPSWRKDLTYELAVSEIEETEEAEMRRESKRASLTLGKKGRGPKQPTVLDENNKVVLVDTYAHAHPRETAQRSGLVGLASGEQWGYLLPAHGALSTASRSRSQAYSLGLHSLSRVVLHLITQSTPTAPADDGRGPGAGL